MATDKTEKNGFKSRLGFLMVSAGCAIGIGNVWKFPYIAGENGGGVFVILYLFFLVIMGVPVLTTELAVGRASRRSVVPAYKALEPTGSKWHLHGWLCIAGCYILMMYYTTVAGWMLAYFFKFIRGEFEPDNVDIEGKFNSMLGSPMTLILFMSIVVILGFLVSAFNIQSGLERISKFMMIGLLVIIIVLVVNSLSYDGVKEGLEFFLYPDFEKAVDIGFGNVVYAAMSQAFFTLSIGTSAMVIFGSYMSRSKTLLTESITICSLDTLVAISSGLIIFPACFSFGIKPDAGPSLIFVTLPTVFTNMSGGRIWGSFFFLFMTFASFSTVIAVFENLNKSMVDNIKVTRRKASVINCLVVLVTSLPCIFGYNLLKHIQFFGGRNILSTEDFIVSNILLPLGSMIFTLFCSFKWGWGFDRFAAEANTGSGLKLHPWMKYYFRFVLPILVLITMIQGLAN